MTRPKSMARVYDSRTYRCVQNGRKVEEVVVPVGSYEDTRLGLEVLEGDSGWQLVDGDADAEQQPVADPVEDLDETVSNANDTSSLEPVDEQPVDEQPLVEPTSEVLGQPDDAHTTKDGD